MRPSLNFNHRVWGRRFAGAVQGERGQGLIEFAFTIPIMLLLIFGLIDFSRAAFTAAVVQWAAQEGARQGITQTDPTVTSVTLAIEDRLVGLDAAQAVITVTPSDGGSMMTVQVTYPFQFVTPMIMAIAGEGIELSGEASMIVQPPLIEGS